MRIPFIPNTLLLLVIGLLILIAVMGYRGHVRTSMMPFPVLDVNQSWFMTSWRIQGLKYDKAACRLTMAHKSVNSRPVADSPIKNGCGWENAVRLQSLAGAGFAGARVGCPVAAALALWMNRVVQPAAQKHLGTRVKRIIHFGTYSCRNIRGSLFSKYLNMRSEHATANAIDIGGFRLENGKTVSVLKHWRSKSAMSKFLKEIHYGACSYFRVVLGPEANRLHADHFHFDRGMLIRCH